MINRKEALIESGSSFEYIVENQNFDTGDAYTLSMTFPMKGCPQNQAIFGPLHLQCEAKSYALLPCSIRDGRFFASGSLSIMEVSDTLIKGQFIQNLNPEDEDDDVDRIYVNTLDLGKYPVTDPAKISVEDARKGSQNGTEMGACCLPWAPIGYDDIVNCYSEGTRWHSECKYLAWQPYLRLILERMAAAIGYTINLEAFTPEWDRALVCNTLPPTWEMPQFAMALPRWTVRDFLRKLGQTMKGAFDIDEQNRTIRFRFYSDIADTRNTVRIENPLDEYTSTVNRDEDDANYCPIKHFRYPDNDQLVWKYWVAPWIHKGGWEIREFKTWQDFISASGRGARSPQFNYVAEIDTVFCSRRVQIYSRGHVAPDVAEKYPYASYFAYHPVDIFSPPDYDEDGNYDELDVVPVTVDYALEGKMMFLPVSGTQDSGDLDTPTPAEPDFNEGIHLSNGVSLSTGLTTGKSRMEAMIERDRDGNRDDQYFDRLYIGFAHDDMYGKYYPKVDTDIEPDGTMTTIPGHPLRLMGANMHGIDIEPKVMYGFTFLSEEIPDVTAKFVIHGKTYIARKLTATFSESGMSPLIKGEFYRVV